MQNDSLDEVFGELEEHLDERYSLTEKFVQCLIPNELDAIEWVQQSTCAEIEDIKGYSDGMEIKLDKVTKGEIESSLQSRFHFIRYAFDIYAFEIDGARTKVKVTRDNVETSKVIKSRKKAA